MFKSYIGSFFGYVLQKFGIAVVILSIIICILTLNNPQVSIGTGFVGLLAGLCAYVFGGYLKYCSRNTVRIRT